MQEGDCTERDVGRGLWEKGRIKRTVGERDAGRELWEKGRIKRTVGKGMQKATVQKGMYGGDCGERVGKGESDAGRGLSEKGREGDCGESDAGRGLWGK